MEKIKTLRTHPYAGTAVKAVVVAAATVFFLGVAFLLYMLTGSGQILSGGGGSGPGALNYTVEAQWSNGTTTVALHMDDTYWRTNTLVEDLVACGGTGVVVHYPCKEGAQALALNIPFNRGKDLGPTTKTLLAELRAVPRLMGTSCDYNGYGPTLFVRLDDSMWVGSYGWAGPFPREGLVGVAREVETHFLN